MHAISHRLRARLNLALAAGVLFLMCGCAPPGPRALLKGDRLLQRGRVAQAIPLLEQAVEHLPDEPRAWNRLGLAYQTAGQPVEAEQAYRRALAFDTNFATARFNLGCLLLEQRQPERAVPELTAYTGLAADVPLGWLKLGHAQLRVNQATAAERSFARALQLQTNSPEALNGLGLSLAQRRRPAEAWPYFAAAAQQEPTYAPARLNLAILAHQAGRDRHQAASAYERYLALRDPPYQDEVRELLRQVRPPAEPEPAAAPAAPEKPRALDPEPVAVVETARPPAKAPTPTAAPPVELATAGKPAARPESPPPQPVTPVVPRRVEPVAPRPEPRPAPPPVTPVTPAPRISEPAVTRTEVATATPGTPAPAPTPPSAPARPAAQVAMPAHLDAAGVGYPYASLGQPAAGDRADAIRLLNEGINAHRAFRAEEALELYRRAAKADPSLFEVHYNRGVAAFEQGEMGEALRAYEQALAIDPDSVPARFNFATTLRRSGYPADAAAQLEQVVAAHPDETRAHLALGDLYARQFRDRQRARERYLRVLELEPKHPNAPALRLWLEAN
jgi:Tfp pilus assembly protein PilF